MSAAAVADLANDPDVIFISPDRPLRGAGTGSPTAVIDHHTDAINAPAAWAQGLDGTGVGVAVIDSGIGASSDLNANNVVYSQDFTGLGSTVDQYGHGTHVAGLIAGNGAASSAANDFYTFKGIAGNASLINLRVLDQNGAGTDSEVIAAIQTAIQLQSTYNIRVINFRLAARCRAIRRILALPGSGTGLAIGRHCSSGCGGNFGRDNAAGTNGYTVVLGRRMTPAHRTQNRSAGRVLYVDIAAHFGDADHTRTVSIVSAPVVKAIRAGCRPRHPAIIRLIATNATPPQKRRERATGLACAEIFQVHSLDRPPDPNTQWMEPEFPFCFTACGDFARDCARSKEIPARFFREITRSSARSVTLGLCRNRPIAHTGAGYSLLAAIGRSCCQKGREKVKGRMLVRYTATQY